jgi:glycine cleavage system aminomethyltransferase T
VEDGLLYPRGPVEHRTTLLQGTRRRSILRERLHQQLRQVPGRQHEIRFLRFRDSRIDGTKVEVARIGMTGNLAYELHGPIEDGAKIYDAVYSAGREFGMERLGWGTYRAALEAEVIKNVRATVARFPYLSEGRNSDLDVSTIK